MAIDCKFKIGDKVRLIDKSKEHYGFIGIVERIEMGLNGKPLVRVKNDKTTVSYFVKRWDYASADSIYF